MKTTPVKICKRQKKVRSAATPKVRAGLAFARETRALPFPGALFLRAQRRKLHVTFLPGFLASLSLRSAYELEQAAGAPAKIDVVAGREFSWLCQKTVRIHCIENELPLEMLLAGQHKGDRFVMRIDQQQKCFVTDRLAFETKNIAGIAT